MQKKSLLLLAMLLTLVPQVVWGQGSFGFEIGGFGGTSIWKERSFEIGPPQVPVDLPPIPLQFKYDDKVTGGIRFNLMSRGHWGGEFSYSYQKNTLSLTRETSPSETLALKGDIQQFFYDMVFYPLRYSEAAVIPFVMGGVGFSSFGLSDSARDLAADPGGLGRLNDADLRFAFNYGLGVKARITRHVGFRVDFRHNFSDVPSFGIPKESSDPAQFVLPIQGKLQNFEASAGIYWRFSKAF
jgi:opacity protein-like surface antigen